MILLTLLSVIILSSSKFSNLFITSRQGLLQVNLPDKITKNTKKIFYIEIISAKIN